MKAKTILYIGVFIVVIITNQGSKLANDVPPIGYKMIASDVPPIGYTKSDGI